MTKFEFEGVAMEREDKRLLRRKNNDTQNYSIIKP